MKQRLLMAVMMIGLLIGLAGSPVAVLAREGESGGGGGGGRDKTPSVEPTASPTASPTPRVKQENKTETENEQENEAEVEHAAEIENENETETEHAGRLADEMKVSKKSVSDLLEDNHSKAAEEIAKLGKDKHQPEERRKNCEARKANLTNRMAKGVSNAEAFKTQADTAFTNAQTFYVDNKLTVDNYETLVAEATAAQTAVGESIAALKALNVSIDCTKETIATDVTAYKLALATTRDTLKAYRTTVKAILTAIETAQ